jgi:peroxiredoxin Q/BCP
MLQSGDFIPDFELSDQQGKPFRISAYLGKKNLVIFFYPKNETPGCTAEACSFRDSYVELVGMGAEVIGISSDSTESHSKFAENHRLQYTLLSDPDGMARNLFGVPKSMLGLLPGRTTFVVRQTGEIAHVFNSQFSPVRHVREAIEAINAINQE